MATKKDLIEAQSFSRRRLLTAFTSGAPAGKELEPTNPLRAVIAGIVLTAMVILAGVFYGLIRPGLPDGWEDNYLILVSDTGTRYVTVGGTLYPVLNTASARLLSEPGGFKVKTTDQATIADIEIGPTVGILGAPDDLPSADSLIGDGWLACAVSDGTSLAIPESALGDAVTGAAVVTRGDDTFVVVDDRRYLVDPERVDPVLRAVGLDRNGAAEVEGRWLNLFQPGIDLAPLTIDGAGGTLAGVDLPVGTAVHFEGTSDTERFVLTAEGELAPLSPVAYQLYLLGTGAELGGVVEVTQAEIGDLDSAGAVAGGVDWPESALAPIESASPPCALLGHTADGSERTVLAAPRDDVEIPGAGAPQIAVGAGALVRSGGAGDETSGTVQLIDETGTVYSIPDADDDPLGRLGYDQADAVAVSGAWLQFLPAGPALTVAAAGQTPSAPQAPAGDDAETSSPSSTATATATAAPAPAPAGTVTTVPTSEQSTVVADADQPCQPGTYVYSPDEPPALALLQKDKAWQTATGVGVTVAIVDSGIDAANPHLAGAVIGGIDLVGDGTSPTGYTDITGHGTAIAGQIAAQQIPESAVVGLAPDARLLAVRVFRADDDQTKAAGFGPDSGRVAAGIRWAADQGAQIINVSLSDPVQVPVVSEAVTYATALGSLVVASVGNTATTTDDEPGPRYPAADAGALGVAASNQLGAVTTDSISGPHVSVAAPGSQVITAAAGGGDCLFATEAPSTSFATGYASAAAALVAQAHPDETPAQWAYRLMATATRANPDARTDTAGWGVIQPAAAIALLPDPDLRGPESPFFDTSGAPISPAGVELTPNSGESPFAFTRESAALLAVGGAAVLGTLGVFGVLRLRRRTLAPAAVRAARGGRGMFASKSDDDA